MKSERCNIFFSKKYNYLQSAFFIMLVFLFFEARCADWTLVVFVQASNSLKNFAQPNFTAMGSVGSSSDLNILVQCYFPQNAGIYRYKIEKGKMVLDAHLQEESDGTTTKDVVDAFRWAKNKYPAQKYALILWNHGIGILDPVWGKTTQWQASQKLHIEKEMIALNPRIRIGDLTVEQSFTCTTQQNVQVAENMFTQEEIDLIDKAIEYDCGAAEVFRGILFNEQSRTYMTNQAFIAALREIKNDVLGGKKIDILGMDACLMAMVEVGYQSRQYAKYLVASEESELAHGWDYAALCKSLSEKATPQKVACGIVSNYEQYYKNKINFYTLSAIDLSRMDDVKMHLDAVVKSLNDCMKIDKKQVLAAVKKARLMCQQFSATNYIDIHSFLVEFSSQIALMSGVNKKDPKLISDFKSVLQKTIALLEQTIVANTSGKLLAKARGLSIYFPLHAIDGSYPQTEFSQASSWTSFLKDFLPGAG